MKPTMRKLSVFALLATIVIAWSLVPFATAKRPTYYMSLGPDGDLVTVGSSCEGITSKPTVATPVEMRGGISTGPVAIWFDFDLTFERHDGEVLVLPGCLVASKMRNVEFEHGSLVFLRLSNIDVRSWKEGKVTHNDRFGFHASDYDKDGTFDAIMKYGCYHKGKGAPPDISQLVVFEGPLWITASIGQ